MMWDKDLIKEMFPSGYLPNFDRAENLAYSDYDVVMVRETKHARDMMIEDMEIVWHPNGVVERNTHYQVYPYPSVNGTPALSVYGGKMLQNWLQLKHYHDGTQEEQEKKESMVNAGFNYTGL